MNNPVCICASSGHDVSCPAHPDNQEKIARLEAELAGTNKRSEQVEGDLLTMHLELDAEKARRVEAEAALRKRAWPVLECPDCDGAGTTGTAPNGKKYSCETCGGNEDSAGRGWIESMDMDTATARADALAKVAGEVALEMERQADRVEGMSKDPDAGRDKEEIRQLMNQVGTLRRRATRLRDAVKGEGKS